MPTVHFPFLPFPRHPISTPTKCKMTLSSSINPASGCTIPTGEGEISSYLHGFGEVGVDTVLAWWHRHVSSFERTLYPLCTASKLSIAEPGKLPSSCGSSVTPCWDDIRLSPLSCKPRVLVYDFVWSVVFHVQLLYQLIFSVVLFSSVAIGVQSLLGLLCLVVERSIVTPLTANDLTTTPSTTRIQSTLAINT
jgi:hypothetical protein